MDKNTTVIDAITQVALGDAKSAFEVGGGDGYYSTKNLKDKI